MRYILAAGGGVRVMILPTKGIAADRALLTVGAQIIAELDEPSTVSGLWHLVRLKRSEDEDSTPLTFDWFVLALDLLFAMGAIRTGPANTLRRAS
ncbi:ABC-three component system middle component 6 [Streptomyces sp. BK205]|uniref:ABC-three component system middle component 6 n=1 Tax=Streptomyces sp. BK205 TaxID=2512164 RepID=UPI0032609310